MRSSYEVARMILLHNLDSYARENSEHWVLTQLLPYLEKPSLTVMDNATPHSVLLEEAPMQSWRRDKIIAWLQEKRVAFP
jgi:hypothetical protein